MIQKTKLNHGFTLIELLVVIAIIGLLSSIVLSSLSQARSKGRDARRISEIKNIQNALEIYRSTNGSYPLSPGGVSAVGSYPLGTPVGTPPGGSMSGVLGALVSGGIMPSFPLPVGGTFYGYTSGQGGTFQTCGGTPESALPYILYFNTENPQPAFQNHIGTLGKLDATPNEYCLTIQ